MTSSESVLDSAALPSAEEVIAGAFALQPALRERAAACEAASSVPEPTIRELVDAGLFKVLKLRRYGGHEMGWAVFCEAVMAIAASCGSTGWVYSVVAGHAAVVNRFGTTLLDELWGTNPDALISSCRRGDGALERVAGGYRGSVTGLFSSGCDHADWIIVDAVPVRGESQTLTIVVPIADMEILDTWKPLGLAGTGSKDVRFTDAFVPDHRVWFPGKAPDGELLQSPSFRTPHQLGHPIGLSTPLLGIAMAGLDVFIDLTLPRRSRGGVRLAEAEHVQLKLAESAAEIEAALALIRHRLKQWMAYARDEPHATPHGVLPAGGTPDADLLVSAFVARSAYSALDRLMQVVGAHQLNRDAPFQRAFRDVLAGIQQPNNSWDLGRIAAGRALFERRAGSD